MFVLPSCKQTDTAELPELPPVEERPMEWELVWSEDFKENGLPNPEHWGYDVGGGGWGNNELQFYTDKEPKNARVEDGRLIIEAIREPTGSRDYSSARLVSRGKMAWKYGKFEFRAKLPSGRGTWPAIWMLPDELPLTWPDDGEIDIMEHVGHDQGTVHGTVHTKAYHHSIGTQKGGQIRIPTVSTEFHDYVIEWHPNRIEWFLDGQRYFEFYNDGASNDTWPFNKPFYLIFNIAVGGNWGGSQGVDTAIWPQRLEIEHIKVYQLK